MQIDDVSVIKSQSAREGVERDLQSSVEVSFAGRFEEVRQGNAEGSVHKGALALRGKLAAGAKRLDCLRNATVESPRRCTEDSATANGNVLIVHAWRQRQNDS